MNLFFLSSDFFFAIFKISSALSIPVIEPIGLTLSEIKNAKSPVPQHKSAQSSPFEGSNKFTNFLFHNLCSPKLNKLFKNALNSLNNAQKINPNISEIYFAKSNIFLQISEQKNAKEALETGLRIEPNNHKAIFQLGNIQLMERNYLKAIKFFDKSIKIKTEFWQAINNKGLAYFETNNINQSINLFEKALSIQENAEPLLGLASCVRINDTKLAIQLAKKALAKDPKYVNYDYRKEQLWGEKIQASTEILLQNEQLKKDVVLAKSKIIQSS